MLTSALLAGCSASTYDVGFDPHAWGNGEGSSHNRRAAPAKLPTPSATPKSFPSAPKTMMVTVGRGDTVYAISRRYDVEVNDIIELNNLTPPYILKPGDRLKLARSYVHVVEKGETGYSISRRYGIDLTSLMQLNRVAPPYGVWVGQRLMIPGGAVDSQAAVNQKPKSPLPPPPPLSSGGFGWPLRGAVISTFGPKGGGLHNDGVNIAATAGEPVLAAQSGVVAYAGQALAGYGNLLLIRHAGGWITAYGHNKKLLVARGDPVRRGQPVALAGQTGNVTTPQLHFEIRQGTVAVDPQAYLTR